MAMIHDLAECIVGDIPPCDGKVCTKEEKQKLEEDAICRIASLLDNNAPGVSTYNPKNKLLELFHEYEERKTPEAIAVKDMDWLDLILQADLYETLHEKNNFNLDEFFVNTPPEKFNTDIVRRYAEEIHRRRARRWEENRSLKENMQLQTNNDQVRRWQDINTLSKDDEAFVLEFAATSTDLTSDDIRSVVRSLRARDRVLGVKSKDS